jgi:hypothetical protein
MYAPTVINYADYSRLMVLDFWQPDRFSRSCYARNVNCIRFTILIFLNFALQMILEGSNAILLIGTTYEEDSGVFTCRVTTAAGQVETSSKLIVKSKNWM